MDQLKVTALKRADTHASHQSDVNRYHDVVDTSVNNVGTYKRCLACRMGMNITFSVALN